MSNPKAVICMPVWRQVEIQNVVGLLQSYGNKSYEVMFQSNDALLERSRARLLWRMTQEYPDVPIMVFIDSDIVFDLPALDDLVSLAGMHKAIVGGVVPTRGGGKMALTLDGPIDVGPGTKPQLVKTIGTSFTAISMSIARKVVERVTLVDRNTEIPFWPVFDTMLSEDGREWFAEDTAFCMRAKKRGAKIYAMTHHQIGHIGTHTFVVNKGRYE